LRRCEFAERVAAKNAMCEAAQRGHQELAQVNAERLRSTITAQQPVEG
jgi:hypothetical protein